MRSVLTALRVLEEVAGRQPIGVGQLARALEMPKSSAQRALVALHAAGWIKPADGELTRWTLTSKALAVGGHVRDDLGLRNAAMPVMEELRRRTDETIHLTVVEEDRIVLIERLETTKPVRVSMSLGHVLPIHASANGKAVLARSAPEVLRRVLGRELPRFTEATVTDPDRLREELVAIRTRGYAINRGEWRSDVGSVASAVLAGPERPVASLSVNIPVTRLTDETLPVLGAAVREAASTVSARLGYAGSSA